MADVWYYAQNGQQAGPVSASQLQQLARSGQIQATDLVWKEGLAQWVQAKAIKGLFPAQAEPVPVAQATPVPAPAERPAKRERDYDDAEEPDRDRVRSRKREDDDDDYDDDRPRRRARADEDDDYDDDRPRRRARADEDDDVEEDRPRRRRRKAAGGWEALPTGAKIGIMVGGLVLIIAAIAVPVIIFMSGGGGGSSTVREGNVTLNERLSRWDARDRVRQGSRCRLYSYKMKAGSTYTIRMLSSQFDAYLRLEDPNGTNVAEDDDGDAFGSLNAKIIYTAPREGVYKIVATTFQPNDKGGDFQLLVTENLAPKNAQNNPPFGGNKNGPPPFVGNKDGIAKKGNIPPFGGNKDGIMKKGGFPKVGGGGMDDGVKSWNDQLTNNDPLDKFQKNSRAKVYNYRMKAGTTYTIRMSVRADDGLDPFLRLENPAGMQVAFDDDGDGFPNAKIIYNCSQDGVYRIIATSFNPNVGAYTLSVTPE
jgi:hypothetical protein